MKIHFSLFSSYGGLECPHSQAIQNYAQLWVLNELDTMGVEKELWIGGDGTMCIGGPELIPQGLSDKLWSEAGEIANKLRAEFKESGHLEQVIIPEGEMVLTFPDGRRFRADAKKLSTAIELYAAHKWPQDGEIRELSTSRHDPIEYNEPING